MGFIRDGKGYRAGIVYRRLSGTYNDIENKIPYYRNKASREQFLQDRVFMDSYSCFMSDDKSGRNLNYIRALNFGSVDVTLDTRLKYFRKNVKYWDILSIVHNACKDMDMDLIYKRFYLELVALRYMCIVLGRSFDASYRALERRMHAYDVSKYDSGE